MENEIERFDPSKLMDGVRDRIKATFVSLIPDGMWDAMVEKEIYVFTTGRIVTHHDYQGTDADGKAVYHEWEERIPYDGLPVTDRYGNPTGKGDNISPLQKMIREELLRKFQEDLKTWLGGAEYNSAFEKHGAPEISKAVEEVLVKNSETIFHNLMAGMMQQAFVEMRRHVSDMAPGMYNNY